MVRRGDPAAHDQIPLGQRNHSSILTGTRQWRWYGRPRRRWWRDGWPRWHGPRPEPGRRTAIRVYQRHGPVGLKPADKEVTFSTQIGLNVKTKLNLRDMMYHGQLAL